MILLQLSAGQGPLECCKAVGLALKLIEKQSQNLGLKYSIIDMQNSSTIGCFKSALIQFEQINDDAKLHGFVSNWQGSMQWVCQSPFRPKHKRKNWFFSGQIYQFDEQALSGEIQFQTCRASGAGGQHVNTTDSAVRATHIASGVSVRVESERSQHANKKLATALIYQKLADLKQTQMTEQEKQRWQQHWALVRGNACRVFKGEKFQPAD